MPSVNAPLLDGELARGRPDGGHSDGQNGADIVRGAEARDDEETEKGETDRRSLKDVIGGRFKIGVGVGHERLKDPADAALIRRHYQIITPDNCKEAAEHPSR